MRLLVAVAEGKVQRGWIFRNSAADVPVWIVGGQTADGADTAALDGLRRRELIATRPDGGREGVTITAQGRAELAFWWPEWQAPTGQ